MRWFALNRNAEIKFILAKDNYYALQRLYWMTYIWMKEEEYISGSSIYHSIKYNGSNGTMVSKMFFFFFFFIKYEDQKQLFLLWSKMDDRLEGCVDILGRSTGHPCEPIKLLGSSSWDDWQVMVHKAHQVMTKSFDQCRRSRMKPYYM